MSFPIPKTSLVQHNKQKKDAPVDTGLIRCICPSTEDDGFTIQCERCLVWQHAFCVHITHANIPDHYLCDQCLKRKRPKLSKRITISKKKFRRLDDASEETLPKRKRPVKSRIISRYVPPLFREARERWSTHHRWKQHFYDQSSQHGPLLCDHGPFVTMDATTLFTKGVLMDTPVSNQGLFAARPIPALRYLMEVTGDILLKSEFKFDPVHDFVILGTPLSHIMFYPTLDLCIDTRQFGNKARYIRRSCHPNAELRNVVLPQSREDKTIHLGLFARHAIEKGQEVTISWNWQRGHVSWKESMNWHQQHKQKHGQEEANGHQVIDEEEQRRRKSTIQHMLDRFEKEFGVCACINKRRCLIEHLKRQCAPPKEKKPIMPSPPSLVNYGRRKSSVILLKPKTWPLQPLGIEENEVNKATRQPLFANKILSKDTSDDELLDVEGDIDVGDDLPAPLDNAPPLLDDNSSDDEENADLSSLSSLSSLSVFEDSTNENSDDDNGENRVKSRKKKSNRHHHHASSKRNEISSPSEATALPAKTIDIPVLTTKPTEKLPRKKLWMRAYLNTHNSGGDSITKPGAEPPTETTVKSEQSAPSVDVPMMRDEEKLAITTETVQLENSIEVGTTKKETKFVAQDTKAAAMIAVAQQVIPESATVYQDCKNKEIEPVEEEEEINVEQDEEINVEQDEEINVEQDEEINVDQDEDSMMADTEEAVDVDVTCINENSAFDMDEGELSDASTILLDDDELEQVYKKDNSPAASSRMDATVGKTTRTIASSVKQEEDIPNNSTLFELENVSPTQHMERD